MPLNSSKKSFWFLVSLIINLILGSLIIIYFWLQRESYFDGIPTYILFLALAYVTIEIIKKNFLQISPMCYQMYYIGLFSIVIPLVIKETEYVYLLTMITKVGTLLLIVPIIGMGKSIISKKLDNKDKR